jgi:hypothetical protein
MQFFFEKRGEKLLLLPIAVLFLTCFLAFLCSAETSPTSYDSLKLSVEGSGEVLTYQDGSNPSIEYFTANLTFYPKDYGINRILVGQNFFSEPDSSITTDEKSILYRWDYPPIGTLKFGFKSEVLNLLETFSIKEKIPFPQEFESAEVQQYLRPTLLITSEDEEIKRKASEIVEGTDDFYLAVHKIASWVGSNIKYTTDNSTLESSKDAKWVFENKIGVCDEITTLFIAMLRSIGIPAKFVSGLAYSNQINDFGSHAWAEVYFPKTGWVGFDVTYGEYGFIDATHVKFRDGTDGASPSVDYAWRGRSVNSEVKGINFKTKILENGNPAKTGIQIKVQILKKEVGAGSYSPVMIEVTNLEDKYNPVTLHVTKAPTQYGENKFALLLPPLETKKIFTIIHVQDSLQEGYEYSSIFEVANFFDDVSGSDTIYYSNNVDIYPYSSAVAFLESMKEEQEYTYSSDVEADCNLDKDAYYASEKMQIDCEIINKGNVNLEEIKTCVLDDCKTLTLLISEKKEVSFDVAAPHPPKEAVLDIASPELVKHEYLNAKIYEAPEIKITAIESPKEVEYKELGYLSFNITVNSPVKDVVVKIGGKSLFHIDEINGENSFMIPAYGSFFYNRDGIIEVDYKDLNRKKQTHSETFSVEVRSVPFYVRNGWLLISCGFILFLIAGFYAVRHIRFRTLFKSAPAKPEKTSKKRKK